MKPTKEQIETAQRANEAMIELWENTTPKVDLDKLTHNISPNDYTMPISLFDSILEKHNVKLSDFLFFFLNKAPKLVKA